MSLVPVLPKADEQVTGASYSSAGAFGIYALMSVLPRQHQS